MGVKTNIDMLSNVRIEFDTWLGVRTMKGLMKELLCW